MLTDRWLWAALVLAATLRVLWVLTVESGTVYTPNLLDSSFYVATARKIWAGRGYLTLAGAPTAKFPPGYSTVLAPVIGLFGPWPAPGLLNALFGTLTCLGAYAIGNRLQGPVVGRVAALLLALLPGHVMASSALMSDVLFGCVLTWLLYAYLLVRERAAPLPFVGELR
jgi:4-amino-4-deoxy-L-arabinose transferase-like glycosyltransferase